MKITFINVGYGDAILLQHENGYTALIDSGSNLSQEFEGNAYRIRAAEYLKCQKITHLQAVFISHIHEDHVCGLEAILNDITVDRLYVPYPVAPFLQNTVLQPADHAPCSVQLYTKALNAYGRILQKARKEDIPVQVLKAGTQLELADGLSVQVLAPEPDIVQSYLEQIEQVYASQNAEEITRILGKLDATSNHTSLLLRFEMSDIIFLAAADSCPSQWRAVPSALLKNVNVLKLPHHGQRDAIDEELMQEMPLQYIITTAASDRRYHSANPEVYNRLLAMCTAPPEFLFSDERNYLPYFYQPDGFQAITLVIDSGKIHPEFVHISR